MKQLIDSILSLRYYPFLIVIICCSGCSLSRSLPEGAYLHKKSNVEIVKTEKSIDARGLEAACQAVIQSPKLNKKFLGIRVKLRLYNLFHTKKQKGIARWLQNTLGEPPVILDELIPPQQKEILESKAFNHGFFNAIASSEIVKKGKTASVNYEVSVEKPYTLGSVLNRVSDSIIHMNINQVHAATLLKKGQPFSLQSLKSERERITTVLRSNGFYFFRDDYLKFKADTLQASGEIQLELTLKPGVDSTHLSPKKIHRIFVFPDMEIVRNSVIPKDTLKYEGLEIIYDQLLLKPATLRETITLKAGQLYTLKTHQSTLERLSFLRNHQFIDVQFKPSVLADSLLNVFVRLTPRKREAIEGALGLSYKSGLYLGPEVSLTYLNRNTFKGAEQFRLTVFGNYNFPLADDIASQQEQGVSLELSKPGLILPFGKKVWADNLIAKSKIGLTFSREKIRFPIKGLKDFLVAQELTGLTDLLEADSTYSPFIAFNKFDFSIGYQWRKRPDIQHELNPLNFILQVPQYEVDELKTLLLLFSLQDESARGLLLNLEKILITKMNYTFLYDSRLKKVRRHNYFYRGKVGLADSRLLSKNNLIPKIYLESQFLQLEQDFRYYRKFSPTQTVAFRLAANVSFPFSNETVLPFFDLYNIGGPYSVRAFQARSVGPGSVEPASETFFFTGGGDVLLESSLEWRPKITDFIEMGFFVDAGNIWLLNGGDNDTDLSAFRFNKFYKQLAIGTGLGFRLDFDILLFRLDFAFPLTKPWLPEGQRWVGDNIKLRSASWRRDNLTFNLAFGYSF